MNTAPVKGVSQVSPSGEVTIFVEALMPRFDCYRVLGQDVQLICQERSVLVSRVYRRSTIEALGRVDTLVVQPIDERGINLPRYRIEPYR